MDTTEHKHNPDSRTLTREQEQLIQDYMHTNVIPSLHEQRNNDSYLLLQDIIRDLERRMTHTNNLLKACQETRDGFAQDIFDINQDLAMFSATDSLTFWKSKVRGQPRTLQQKRAHEAFMKSVDAANSLRSPEALPRSPSPDPPDG